MITKTDFDAKLSSLNRKITNNKSKHLLVENELNKLKPFDSSCFNGKSYFEDNDRPNYLIFQAMSKYFKLNGNTQYILSWKSKALSSESITLSPVSNNLFNPLLGYSGTKARVKFSRIKKTIKNFIYSWKSSKCLHCL